MVPYQGLEKASARKRESKGGEREGKKGKARRRKRERKINKLLKPCLMNFKIVFSFLIFFIIG